MAWEGKLRRCLLVSLPQAEWLPFSSPLTAGFLAVCPGSVHLCLPAHNPGDRVRPRGGAPHPHQLCLAVQGRKPVPPILPPFQGATLPSPPPFLTPFQSPVSPLSSCPHQQDRIAALPSIPCTPSGIYGRPSSIPWSAAFSRALPVPPLLREPCPALPTCLAPLATRRRLSSAFGLLCHALCTASRTSDAPPISKYSMLLHPLHCPLKSPSSYHLPSRLPPLPLQVNAAGVMPVIFATTLMSVPSGLARFTDNDILEGFAAALYPTSVFYLPTYVTLIVFFNYYYTFLQLDPKDVSDQLRKQVKARRGLLRSPPPPSPRGSGLTDRQTWLTPLLDLQGASIPAVRPGKATAEFITEWVPLHPILPVGSE